MERLNRAFQGVDYVIHTAALKQVPTLEYNPFEAVKTNILGAQNVINVAIDQGVKRVIALSTDKAANPINLYGATKLCSDKLFIAGNSYTKQDGTIFGVVRYGNVVGSRGSVIPFFLKQREKGVSSDHGPAHDPFLDHPGAGSRFRSSLHGEDGRRGAFVPKIPSMKLMDLAKAIAPECKIEIIGIRPGRETPRGDGHEGRRQKDNRCG